MGKLMYQIIIKENYVNDYILGWIFNCKMYYETYLEIRNYINRCYPNIKIEYFEIIGDRRVEA